MSAESTLSRVLRLSGEKAMGTVSLLRLRLSFATENTLARAWQEAGTVRWVPLFAATAAAHLVYFYAGVYLELSKPPSLVIFIGAEQ